MINFLLSTEIIPLCLRTMEMGSELSKTVATFIVQKILLDDVGGGEGGGRAAWASERCLAVGPLATPRRRGAPRQRAGGCGRAPSPRAGTGQLKHATPPLPAPTSSPAQQVGLNYICATAERFFAVGAVLGNMVVTLAEQPSPRLLKHIIRCYLRLSDNPRAREALRQCLPELLRNPGFTACLKSDDTTRRWLAQLLTNVGFPEAAAQLSNEMLQPTPLQGQ